MWIRWKNQALNSDNVNALVLDPEHPNHILIGFVGGIRGDFEFDTPEEARLFYDKIIESLICESNGFGRWEE